MGDTAPKTFAEKFEEALERQKQADPDFGLRTLARKLAKDDPRNTETIRRRLHKYRPPKGGGTAEVAPTEPTRWEIEDALGLGRDSLAPDTPLPSHEEMIAVLLPSSQIRHLIHDEVERLMARAVA